MKNQLGLAVIVTAVIWAADILATSMVIDTCAASARILSIQGGGAAATIILLGGMAVQVKHFR